MATYNGHYEDSSGNILLPIGGSTASVESGSTASQVYAKGSYLFFNNRLCKATVAIASGTTLVIGTNLSQVSLADEIKAHLVASNGVEFTLDDYLNGEYS